MGAFFYLDGLGRGYSFLSDSEMVRFTFPGALGDDIISMKPDAVTETDGKGEIKCTLSWNTNLLKQVKIAAVKVEDKYKSFTSSGSETLDADIKNGVTPSQILTSPGEVTLTLPEEGLYNIIAIAYDKTGADKITKRHWTKFTPQAVQAGNWKSLGKGIYRNVFFTNSYSVEVEQDLDKPGRYRLVKPYTEALMLETNPWAGGVPYRELINEAVPDYVEFQLVRPGENFPTKDAPMSNGGDNNTAIYIPSHSMGWNFPSDPCYGSEVWCLYYANYTYQYSDACYGQRVVTWQKEPENTSDGFGIPRVVGLGSVLSYSGSNYVNPRESSNDISFEFPDIVADTRLLGMNFVILSEENKTAAVYRDGLPEGELVIPSQVNIKGKDYTVTAIKEPGFSECDGLTSVVIPETVNSIAPEAFAQCGKLTKINIPQTVTTIPYGCFIGTGFASFAVPNHVKAIGAYAFRGCPLETVTLTEGVQRIGTGAFSYTNLETVSIPSTVTELGTEEWGELMYSPFDMASGLSSINVHPDNPVYKDIDGVLLSKDGTILWDYPDGKSDTSYAVPSTVKHIAPHVAYMHEFIEDISFPDGLQTIGQYAFSSNRRLKSIVLPQSVTNVETYAFNGCTNVTELTLSSAMKKITPYAFSDLALTELTVPEGIEEIEMGGFGYMADVTSIKLPSTLKRIDIKAFINYRRLETVTCANPEPPVCTIKDDGYSGVHTPFTGGPLANCVLRVPRGSELAYKEAPVWKDFGIIEEYAGVDDTVADSIIDDEEPVEWYNLQGQRVYPAYDGSGLAPGFYIKRQGNTTAKVVVR